MNRRIVVAAIVSALPVSASAADLTLHLAGSGSFSHTVEKVECEAGASQLGLPRGAFSVEYFNGGKNSLAIVPVEGESLIFANVVSGSGARYAARQYIWWDAGDRGITFSTDSLAGKKTITCHALRRRSGQ